MAVVLHKHTMIQRVIDMADVIFFKTFLIFEDFPEINLAYS